MVHAMLGLICLATAAGFAAAAGNQLLDPELVMVPAPLPNEPPIRAKTEENQKSRLWREDHIVYPEWVVPEQKTGIVSVAASHPVDVKATARAVRRRLQASCPSSPPPAPVVIPTYCPGFPNLPLLNSTMGFSGTSGTPILLQRNLTTGTYIDSGGVFEWTSNCPVAINLGNSENLYTKVYLQPRWKLKYAWETSQSFIMFPDWHQIPYYFPGIGQNVILTQSVTYFYFGSLNFEYTFQPVPAPTFRDFYHRTASWVGAAKAPRRACCTMRCSLLAFYPRTCASSRIPPQDDLTAFPVSPPTPVSPPAIRAGAARPRLRRRGPTARQAPSALPTRATCT